MTMRLRMLMLLLLRPKQRGMALKLTRCPADEQVRAALIGRIGDAWRLPRLLVVVEVKGRADDGEAEGGGGGGDDVLRDGPGQLLPTPPSASEVQLARQSASEAFQIHD